MGLFWAECDAKANKNIFVPNFKSFFKLKNYTVIETIAWGKIPESRWRPVESFLQVSRTFLWLADHPYVGIFRIYYKSFAQVAFYVTLQTDWMPAANHKSLSACQIKTDKKRKSSILTRNTENQIIKLESKVRKFPIFRSTGNIPLSQSKLILKIRLIEIKVLGGVLLIFK